MFEFPGGAILDGITSYWLPPLLSNNSSFVHRFPKKIIQIIVGVVNGPFKNMGLPKLVRNFSGLAVLIFARMSASRSLTFLQGS